MQEEEKHLSKNEQLEKQQEEQRQKEEQHRKEEQVQCTSLDTNSYARVWVFQSSAVLSLQSSSKAEAAPCLPQSKVKAEAALYLPNTSVWHVSRLSRHHY